ncbi:unnamed protein product, partial [Mesorhabditis belari]|uniref:Uncharacterized protein n=1 Tax=Mesorhabditis belari TaxID=2138241 RepID=A0AAF3FC86_9BILA
MDFYIAYEYSINNNASTLTTFIANTVQPLTFGYLHYITPILLALCIYIIFASFASSRSDRFYANGYIAAVILWPTLYNIRLVYHETFGDIGFAQLGFGYATSFEAIHLLETTSFINLSFCSFLFMASHLLAFVDKKPYSGGLAYLLLWIPSFGLSYALFTVQIPVISRCLVFLVSVLPSIALIAAAALSLLYLLLSGAFSFRISMKKYYKPALLVFVSAACHWNTLWISYRTVPKLLFGPITPEIINNTVHDWPKSYPVQHAKRTGGEVVPILVREMSQEKSSQSSGKEKY